MAVFDITDIVTGTNTAGQSQDYDPYRRHDRTKTIDSLQDWLHENVGEYYGRGDDHTDHDTKGKGSIAIRIGSGWEITRDWRGDPGGYVEVWWKLDITDEIKSTLFALKWM